ncbi:MAG TPA: hypothetical protein PKE55_05005 [Kiritimatiellia bacterium]|nr:hypothetical protein [Kiritimatiellia bacterium]
MTQLEFPFQPQPPPRPTSPAHDPVCPLELPRDPAERGFQNFRSEREAAIQRLQEKFGIVLNRRVRVTLAGFPGDFTGIMTLDQLIPPGTPREALLLRIGKVQFEARDLESCVVIPAQENSTSANS